MKSFEGIMIIRITKKIIWTNPDGQVAQCEDYQLPFHDVVPPDPSFEDMHQVIRFTGRWNIMWMCKIKEIYCIKFAFSLSHAAVFRWSVFDKWGQNALPDGKVGSEHSNTSSQRFLFFLLNIWLQFLFLLSRFRNVAHIGACCCWVLASQSSGSAHSTQSQEDSCKVNTDYAHFIFCIMKFYFICLSNRISCSKLKNMKLFLIISSLQTWMRHQSPSSSWQHEQVWACQC